MSTANPVELEAQRARAALERLRLPAFPSRDPARPLVVAIEGPNGSGKSTLCQTLAQRLSVPLCLGTDKAWFSDSFKVRMIRDADWFASAMFFLSGCFEQMRVLKGSRERFVLMDRCLWSTLAVHAAEGVRRLEALLAMLQPFAGEVQVPDLTLVLEASFAVCQSRIANKGGTARALDELTATAGFHQREAEFYSWLGHQRPEVEFLNVETLSAEDAAHKAAEILKLKIGQC